MGEPKVNIGVKVNPELKTALEACAAKEKRTVSGLCEILLEWSVDQVEIAGSAINLGDFILGPRSQAAKKGGRVA
jgi:hypothetical protein